MKVITLSLDPKHIFEGQRRAKLVSEGCPPCLCCVGRNRLLYVCTTHQRGMGLRGIPKFRSQVTYAVKDTAVPVSSFQRTPACHNTFGSQLQAGKHP